MENTVLNIKLTLNGLLLCLSVGLFIVKDCRAYKMNSAVNSFLLSFTNCAGGGYLCQFGHEDLTYKFKPRCINSVQRCNGFKDCPDGDDEKGCRCNDLPSVKFGRFQLAISGNDTLGALAYIHCNFGYVVSGKKNIRCSTDTGKWESWLGLCEPIKCGSVPQVENGQFVSFDKGVLGDVAVLTCNKGSYSTNSLPTIIKCLPTGQWTDNNDKCVIKVCGRLPVIRYGTYKLISGNNEVGSIASLTCESGGFGVVDHIRCESNGTWKALADQKCDGLIDDVRLVDGSNSRIGRLELFINGIWGTVCRTNFGTDEAKVACRMLGFPTDNAQKVNEVVDGLGAIWLRPRDCDGTELSLLDCERNYPLLIDDECDHDDDVWVSCE